MSFTAKSIIVDVADNYGYTDYTGIRSIEFKLAGTLVALTGSAITCYETSKSSPGSYGAEFAFDTSTSKTGGDNGAGWLSAFSSPTNQRIICVCTTAIEFDEIVINNYHSGSGFTTPGAQNIKINISSDSITSTVYDSAISNSTKIFDSTIAEHISADSIDDQSITLDVPWDGTVDTPEILIPIIAEADMQISISLPEVEISSSASMESVFNGIGVEIPEILIASDSWADMQINILAPEVEIPIVAGADLQIGIALPEVSILSAASTGAVATFKTTGSLIRYFLTITGAADGLADVDLPIASFNSRRRSGDPTYLQAVIPSVDYIDYLTDRPNGTMIISQGYERDGEVLQRERIIETSIDDVNSYQGGTNNSIVLIGYTTSTYSPKSVALEGLTYKATVGGKTTYRLAEPSIFLSPGDEVTIGSDVFTVGVISYSISALAQQIELEEA